MAKYLELEQPLLTAHADKDTCGISERKTENTFINATTADRDEEETDGNVEVTREFAANLNNDPEDTVYHRDDPNRTKFEEAAIYVREGELYDKFCNHPKGQWSKLAYKIYHHPVYHILNFSLTVFLMLLALVETPSVISDGDEPTEEPLVTIHAVLELLILSLLGANIFIRLFWTSLRNVVKKRRVLFMILVLFVMLIEALVVLVRQKSHVRVTRALRPIFFIDTYLMIGVRRVLVSIYRCLKVIVDVIFMLLFAVAVFSLIGYYIFADVDPAYFQTFGISFVSLFVTTTTANNPDVMMEAYSFYAASPIFFCVYLVITLYFFTNILLAVVISNFSEEQRVKFKKVFCHKRQALIHAYNILKRNDALGILFDDFLLFMQQYSPRMPEWQVMCLFKALSQDQQSELSQEGFIKFYKIQSFKWKMDEKKAQWFENFPVPIKALFQKIHAIVKWKWFNSIFYVIIVLNLLFLVIYIAIKTKSETPSRFNHIHFVLPVSFLFLLAYIIEIVLKFLALGPIEYFKKFWNVCDCVVILVSLVALCLEFHPLYHHLAIVRPIKLIRMVRLKKGYRDIMNVMVILIPRLISVSLLLVVIYYFFAIVGMEAFHFKVYEGCCQNASYSVGQYYAGSINSSTPDPDVYYLNNFNNLPRSFVTLFILMVVNNWYIIMEGFASEVSNHWAARVYFFSFYMVTLVVLQVVISFMVEAFNIQMEHASHREQSTLPPAEQQDGDSDSVEDENRKEKIQVTLLEKDIQKLTNVISRAKEQSTDVWCYCFDHFVKKLRRTKLSEGIFTGKRLRTNDDLYLKKYRDQIEQWTQEQDKELEDRKTRGLEDMKNEHHKGRKEIAKKFAKDIATTLLE